MKCKVFSEAPAQGSNAGRFGQVGRAARLAIGVVLLAIAGLSLAGPAGAQAATSAAVSLRPANPTFADTVTVTVTVAGAGGHVPTGTVTYSVDGGTAQTVTVGTRGANGVAFLQVAPQRPGSHTLAVSYGGDANFQATDSQTTPFTVTDLPVAVIGGIYALNPFVYTHVQNNGWSSYGISGVAVDGGGNVFLAYGLTGTTPDPGLAEISADLNYHVLPATGLGRDLQLAVDGSGTLYVADPNNSRVMKYTAAAGLTALNITGLQHPTSLSYEASSNALYVIDTGLGGVIRYDLRAGTQTTVFSGVTGLDMPVTTDGAGGLYYAVGFTPYFRATNGTVTPIFGEFNLGLFEGFNDQIQGLAYDTRRHWLYVAIEGASPVASTFVLDADGHVRNRFPNGQREGLDTANQIAVSGDGTVYGTSEVFTPGAAANLGPDQGLAPSDSAVLMQSYAAANMAGVQGAFSSLILESHHEPGIGTASWIDLDNQNPVTGASLPIPVYGIGLRQWLASTPGNAASLQMSVGRAGGIAYSAPYRGYGDTIYASDQAVNQVVFTQYEPNTDGTLTFYRSGTAPFTGLVQPGQLAAIGSGYVWVMDQGAASGGTRILRLDPSNVQTVAYSAATGDPAGLLSNVTAFTADGATKLFLAGTENGTGVVAEIDSLGLEQQIATGLGTPAAIAVDAGGNVFVADTAGTLVRVDHHSGAVTTLATGLPLATGISLDPSGTVYLASAGAPAVVTVDPSGSKGSLPVPGVTNAAFAVEDYTGNLHVVDGTTGTAVAYVRSVYNIVNFGNVAVNTSATHNATLTNVGNVASPALQLVQATGTPFTIAAGATNGCPVQGSSQAGLAVGASCQVALTYAPTAVHSDSAQITVNSDIEAPTYNYGLLSSEYFQVQGAGVANAGAPVPVLTPATLAFGNVTETRTSAVSVATLTNTGNAALTVSGIALTGTSAGSYQQTATTCGGTLAAGSSCTISLTCTPNSAGPQPASLVVSFPSPLASVSSALTCTGATSAAPGASLSPATQDFGSLTVGATSATETFTLASTGTAALNLQSIAIGGTDASSFVITGGSCSTAQHATVRSARGGVRSAAAVAAGASCTVTVVFTPGHSGASSATLSITDDAGTQTSALTGTGNAVVTTPQAALTPGTGGFGAVSVGASGAVQTFTLSNPGTATLAITSIGIAGPNASSFPMQGNTCGASLAAGASCTVMIGFTPAAAGAVIATLTVVDAVGTQTAALSGSGTAVVTAPSDFTLAVTPRAETGARGAAMVYTVQLQSVTAANPFTSAVALSVDGLPAGARATFAPAAVVPGTSQPAASQMTVTVPVLSAEAIPVQRNGGVPAERLACLLAPVGLAAAALRRRRFAPRWLALLCLVGIGFTVTGCGSGTGFGLPASSSTLTVTGTSGPITHTATVTLTVR
ncbi:choice-of-anchor D domain-containing protein [Terriglobus aquaticus]|uniref:Choice-of-anchor D domain-containing protein n=1 Tax=Terriglobus aquaticus TaxID=940139 RepID=A0ABW9KN60_9BACT|nr:choice-of-anchor D domain-containing protein [Terriglobus aquaticus]